MEKYSHVVSLGYFCSVATELNKIGLRSSSLPFDWCITEFTGVIEAVESRFESFLDYNNMAQNSQQHNIYKDEKYNVRFFHDFVKYRSLAKQLKKVKEKYDRRTKRFFDVITEPTLFVRYISDEIRNPSGKSAELRYIEDNYDEILALLKSFNKANSIIFIANSNVSSDVISIYPVEADENDIVARSPLDKNESLKLYLNSIEFEGRQENIARFERQEKRKNSTLRRMYREFIAGAKEKCLREYIHDRQF